MILIAKLLGVTVRGALLSDFSHQARDVLRLRGPDTVRFVQGTVSADVASPRPGLAIAGALLTVKGKLVSDLVVLPQGEQALDLLVPAEIASDIGDMLDRHIIMDQVEVERPKDVAIGITWISEDDETPTVADTVSTWLTRHPVPGRLLVGEVGEVRRALAEVDPADDEALTWHRIVTGTPAWGYELQAGLFPPEVGFTYGVSYDKGCFMGQEPLARIHARGQVNRVMVRVETDAGPSALSHPDRPQAGRLTSVARGRGLAVVRRDFAAEGTVLQAEGGTTVTVISGPLGDDAGVVARKG